MYPRRQTVRGSISAAEIVLAYKKAFHIPWWRMALSYLATLLGVGGIFQLADAYYREMTDEGEQLFLDFLEKDKTDLEQYKLHDFDCDDFEFRLHGAVHEHLELAAMPIFITWVSWIQAGQRVGHAVKSYYKAGVVKIVEPQNDNVYHTPETWRLDLLCG